MCLRLHLCLFDVLIDTAPGLCLCLIVGLCCGSLSESDAYEVGSGQSADSLGVVGSHEVTYPRWMHPDRHKRSAPPGEERPSRVEVVITAEGQELRLRLQRNEQLLAPGYQEIWYSPSGSRLASSPPSSGHCLYQGQVLGVAGSSAALSTCDGLRGLITLNTSLSYLIQPLPVAGGDRRPHAVFRAESLLRTPGGSCQHHHGDREQGEALGDLILGMMSSKRGRARERRDVSLNRKYVELLLVADHAEFQKHGGDLEKTKLKLLEAANYVDKYYKALGIRVALIGLEIWSDQDKINVSDNPFSTLGAFLSWRRKTLHTLPNDNAQLITGVAFQGTTIGLAPLKAMCSEYQSGGVNSDHSELAVGVAATMAHEMGHNFGMSHDSAGCCQARPDDGGCIMAAATGHPFPRVFNPCNQRELKSYLSSGGGKCLFNLPNTRAMYGGQRCGNGYLEDGEECDCGDEQECTSPCCNANNCTLRAGAECAHGVCCHECKLKSPGVLCRPPSGSCDLPEYCDGKAESCPANFYLVDGTSCAEGRAYCYTGMCLTLGQQCQSLWGRDGRPAPDVCFEQVNQAGNTFGNCGRDLMGKYRGCRERDAKCGKIQCLSSAPKPIETNAVAIDTTVTAGDRRVLCRGTHVYRPGQGDDGEGQAGDTLDPGLVLTGTKCGQAGICFGGECRNASFLKADECNAKCHGHGLCNNNHNCHCDAGWAPPLCNQGGSGGSLDSGPVLSHSSLLPVLLLLPLAAFALLALVGIWCRYRHKLGPLKTPGPPPPPICPVPTEAKPFHVNGQASGHTSDQANGHANPTFLLKGQSAEPMAESGSGPVPSGSIRGRPAIVRPSVKPPPVPAYAAQQSERQAQPPPTTPSASPPLPALSPRPHPSPPVTSKPRPEPPSRPPPPLPQTKAAQEKPMRSLQVTTDALQRGKTSLAPPTGQKKNRSQNKISGKS